MMEMKEIGTLQVIVEGPVVLVRRVGEKTGFKDDLTPEMAHKLARYIVRAAYAAAKHAKGEDIYS